MLELLNRLMVMKQFFIKYKQVFKYLILIGLTIEIIWLTIIILTKKPQMPVEDKAKLDSIAVVTKQLEARQRAYDSAFMYQNHKVDTIRAKVDSLKSQTIIVREHYHEVIKKIDNFTDAELDSFFKSRYKF